ncbi:hypothetical protein C4D60_Mb04t03610 [Musa balbisiana]|uniref:Sodium/calcium exchanger membrane region domain-containing protein n=1 Tax=Musa balbisiana TaxID=52838 RepID=A0A4S8K9H6_MUSBA|nr:hypothetical protein C4D60_Mb04t03610 [Musa balbisiana]
MERPAPESLANSRGVVRVQAPPVDSVSCYCKVDSSLKTIIGARKFVPGAKLCLQPEIMPNGPRSRNSRRERSRNQEPLVPGLPDDLAIACLVRLGIIRNNMSISLVDVTDPGNSVETNSARAWETVVGKGKLKNIVTSLWSSIAGHSNFKGRIVHCQSLCARIKSIQVSAAISGLHWIEIRCTVGCAAMASTGYEAARRLEGGELKGGRMSKEAQHGHGRTAHNMSSSSLRKKSDLSLVSKVRCRFLRALLANLQEIFLGTKLFVLFPAVPLAVAASYFNFGRAWLFALSLLGLAPLAERVSFLTEQIAYFTGPTVGGLLNATCGNATELIIALFALREGKIEVVKCSLVGSVLSNLLLVLGTSLFFGGLANLHKEQFYDRKQADVNTGLLLLGALCHILLLMFGYAMNSGEHAAVDAVRRLALSRACSVVMLLAYVAYLFFQLKTHRQLFESKEGDEDHDDGASEDEPVIGFPCAVAWLVGMTTVIAALSEYVVGTIEVLSDPLLLSIQLPSPALPFPALLRSIILSVVLQAASDSWGISVSFISIILLPIVGNAAEHAGAIIFAFKNKLDITLGVSLGSATQISMFVVPLSVLVAWIMGIEMDLDLKLLETGSLIMAILVIAFTLQDGTAHYLKGLVPLLCYIAIAACFYVYRSPSHTNKGALITAA